MPVTLQDLQDCSRRAFLPGANSEKIAAECKQLQQQYDLQQQIAGVLQQVSIIGSQVGGISSGLLNGIQQTNASLQSGILAALQAQTNAIINSNNTNTFNSLGTLVNGINGAIDRQTATNGNIFGQLIGGVNNAVALVTSTSAQVAQQLGVSVSSALDKTTQINQLITDKVKGSIDEQAKANQAIADALAKLDLNPFPEIIEFLEGLIDDAKNWLLGGLGDIGEGALNFISTPFRELKASIRDTYATWDGLASGRYDTYQEFRNAISDTDGSLEFANFLFEAVSIVPSIMQMGNIRLDPVFKKYSQLVSEDKRPNLLQLSEYVTMYIRGNVTEGFLYEKAGLLGFKKPDVIDLVQSVQPYIGIAELWSVFNKGVISESVLMEWIEKQGYSHLHATWIKKALEFIPPIQDVIRFAVKEVYSPNIAQAYGQFQDFPAQFAVEAKKLGMTEEQAKQYWAAHWDLPSPNMAFNMFQRRIIDINQLRDLLKALDIMPFWRDKLISLSYDPLTRVDIRRMHKLGVINENQVYEAYLDTGYSPENARRLQQFTIRYNAAEDRTSADTQRELTQGFIVSAYKRGAIDRTTALNRLVSINFTIDDANFILAATDYQAVEDVSVDRSKAINEHLIQQTVKSYTARLISEDETREYLTDLGMTDSDIEASINLADLDYIQDIKAEITKEVRELYIGYELDQTEVLTFLTGNGFTADEVNRIIDEIAPFRQLRGRKLTLPQYKKAFTGGIITEDEFIFQMKGLGYSDLSISIYLQTEGIEGV